MPRAEQPGRVIAPGRRQHDLRAGAVQQPLHPPQQLAIHDVGKLRGFGVLLQFRTPSMSRKMSFMEWERQDRSVVPGKPPFLRPHAGGLWVATDADTKLVPSWFVGSRDSSAAFVFLQPF